MGPLRPYAAQPRVVCQSKEYLVLQPHTQVLPAFCPSPWASHSPQEGTYGGSSISKIEQCRETFSSWHFHAAEGQIGDISLWAHCKQPETPIYIVFPQTIGIPANCVICVWENKKQTKHRKTQTPHKQKKKKKVIWLELQIHLLSGENLLMPDASGSLFVPPLSLVSWGDK